MDEQTWVEALNINPDLLAQWSSIAPAGKPLLVWCLEEGHVALEAYLGWAMERYGLARLSNGFFESEGFENVVGFIPRDEDHWQPWCFPVGRWESLTYVACVEPPPGGNTADYVYVLADPRVLREVWESGYESHTSLQPPEPPPINDFDAPIGIQPTAKTPFRLNLDDGAFLMPEAETEVPDSTSKTRVAPMPQMPAVPPLPSDPPELPPRKPAEESMTDVLHARPGPPGLQELTSLTQPTGTVRQVAEIVPVLDIPSDERQALAKVFTLLKKTYSHACILKCNETAASLYQADPGFTIPDAKKVSLDLSYPSFLRIVAKTMQSYHGYLVDTPAHREFFKSLGMNEIPACATAVPLMVKSHLWGILIATGDEHLQAMDNLAQVEQIGAELTHTLAPVWSKVA